MRRILTILVVVVAGGLLLARGGMQSPRPKSEGEKKLIDMKSDLAAPVAPGDSAFYMTRNFAALHNGAVITCDSAVRYSPMHVEFFGNVLINKNTTYIYGDRAEYDGTRNEARVYSDLVKVVDGDATLYTYQFSFNTKDNIGEFADGGVLINRDSRLEATRGYYYADTKELVAVERVEMRNEEYELTGDSVIYNMATDNAYFFENTNIWNRDGDYLYADEGAYRKLDTLYLVTRNGYLLTEKQEMWSDSIDYWRMREHVVLRQSVQIDDTEHKVLAFGDYGEYWKEPGNALLTRCPALVSYDRTQGDSLFMRSDTIYLLTVNEAAEARRAAEAEAKAAAAAEEERIDPTATPDAALSGPQPAAAPTVGEVPASADDAAAATAAEEPAQEAEGEIAAADSLAVDSLSGADTVQLTPAQRKAKAREEARKAKAEQRMAERALRKAKADSIGLQRREREAARLREQQAREDARVKSRRERAAAKLRARLDRAAQRGKDTTAYWQELHVLDSLLGRLPAADTLGEEERERMQDSLPPTPGDLDSLAADSLPAQRDSIYRLIKGFRNVRAYRSDFQAVCDSITSLSTDSTLHLYIDPVLWNENNQITSDWMDIYTANQQLTRAEFVGSPLMASELDTTHYNQVAGKEMTAYFRDNAIYREDVKGNAQTIYYMQDGEPPQIVNVGFLESGDASFYIEEKQVVKITYRINPEWHIYPIGKVPEDRELYLKGFKWQGSRRPAQQDVFDGEIRPTRREEVGGIYRPGFPILRRIEEHKHTLMELGRWDDRVDEVDPETTEWMRTLGFEPGQPRDTER